jgi:hypothetical protein
MRKYLAIAAVSVLGAYGPKVQAVDWRAVSDNGISADIDSIKVDGATVSWLIELDEGKGGVYRASVPPQVCSDGFGTLRIATLGGVVISDVDFAFGSKSTSAFQAEVACVKVGLSKPRVPKQPPAKYSS